MSRKKLLTAAGLMAAFAAWTAAVRCIDVQAIGPQGTAVGFATLNRFFHRLTGVHMTLYTTTDWLGLVPVLTAAGFALLGLCQWIRRKKLLKVDRSILFLGVFYALVIGAYLFFEAFVINYRPVLINGTPEASYPSSTTLLVLCVMPTAAMQLKRRIKDPCLRQCALAGIHAFTVLMIIARLISGVHWLSDIIGSLLLSGGLVMLYRAACSRDLP
ncbi:MAG: phosphatase PAP2 family protein [Clostridia bacterium]|nr:phosphatase PAP2 family protein [Clostridia bacterium]